MRQAIKNFILALFAVGSLVVLGWIIASNRGLSKPEPHPFPHRFLDAFEAGPRPLVVAFRGLSSEYPPNSKLAFEKAAALGPKTVLWVDARPSADGTWMAWSDRSLKENTDGSTWTAYTKDSELAKLDAAYRVTYDGGKTFPFRGKGFHIETLETILTAFPNHLFVINLRDYQEGGKDKILKLLNDTKAGERSLIASPEDGILRDLREAEPTWLYGTSRAQVTRLIMLSQLFLSASAPMRGDVFVWDMAEPVAKLNDRAWHEIQRRKMKSVVAVDDAVLGSEWATRADAIITSRPQKFSPNSSAR